MRHVLPALEIAGVLQCLHRCPDARLYVCHRLVPSRLTRDLERCALYDGSVLGQILDRLPNLLNLTDTEFRLVQQHKMLVQIPVLKQHIALCLQILVSARAPCLLHIIFQRVRYIIVYHQLDIGFVHPHAKGGGCHHHLNFIADKSILIHLFLCLVHLSVKGKRGDTVITQLLCKLCRALCPRHIHDGGAVFLFNQPAQRRVFLLVTLLVKHLIAQIFPARTRSVQR